VTDDLGVQFFATAKAQYESAGKWRLIVVAAIAYLHIALVTPFAAQMSDKAAVDREIAGYRAAEKELKQVLVETADIASRQDSIAKDLRDDLVRRFAVLREDVSDLTIPGPAGSRESNLNTAVSGGAVPGPASSGDLPPPSTENARRRRLNVDQAPINPNFAPSTRPPGASLPDWLQAKISDESAFSGPGGISDEFATYIEAKIIAPAFQKANDNWQKSVVPDLKKRAGELEADIKNAKAKAQVVKEQAKSLGEQLDSLEAAIEKLLAEAEKLTFEPPPGQKRWWQTISGKDVSIQSIMAGVEKRVREIDTQKIALTDLQEKTADITNQKKKVLENINTALERLDKQAADLQSQLGELGGPLKAVNFRLSQLAPLMPLIVGLALAGITAWSAEGLRRMSLAARLVGDESQGSIVKAWLVSTAGGSPRRIAVQEILLAIVSVGWVLAAAWTVSTLAVSFRVPLVILAVAAVLAARLYHWYWAGDALVAARD